MTTIHAYTGTQMTLDGPSRSGKEQDARAAAENIIPHTTGSARLSVWYCIT